MAMAYWGASMRLRPAGDSDQYVEVKHDEHRFVTTVRAPRERFADLEALAERHGLAAEPFGSYRTIDCGPTPEATGAFVQAILRDFWSLGDATIVFATRHGEFRIPDTQARGPGPGATHSDRRESCVRSPPTNAHARRTSCAVHDGVKATTEPRRTRRSDKAGRQRGGGSGEVRTPSDAGPPVPVSAPTLARRDLGLGSGSRREAARNRWMIRVEPSCGPSAPAPITGRITSRSAALASSSLRCVHHLAGLTRTVGRRDDGHQRSAERRAASVCASVPFAGSGFEPAHPSYRDHEANGAWVFRGSPEGRGPRTHFLVARSRHAERHTRSRRRAPLHPASPDPESSRSASSYRTMDMIERLRARRRS